MAHRKQTGLSPHDSGALVIRDRESDVDVKSAAGIGTDADSDLGGGLVFGIGGNVRWT